MAFREPCLLLLPNEILTNILSDAAARVWRQYATQECNTKMWQMHIRPIHMKDAWHPYIPQADRLQRRFIARLRRTCKRINAIVERILFTQNPLSITIQKLLHSSWSPVLQKGISDYSPIALYTRRLVVKREDLSPIYDFAEGEVVLLSHILTEMQALTEIEWWVGNCNPNMNHGMAHALAFAPVLTDLTIVLDPSIPKNHTPCFATLSSLRSLTIDIRKSGHPSNDNLSVVNIGSFISQLVARCPGLQSLSMSAPEPLSLKDLLPPCHEGTSPMHLIELHLYNILPTMDQFTRPHLRSLETLTARHILSDDKYHDLMKEGVYLLSSRENQGRPGLRRLETDWVDHYGHSLIPDSGLEYLSLSGKHGNDFDRHFKTILPNHFASLSVLHIDPAGKREWCYSRRMAESLLSCKQLRELSISVAIIAPGGSTHFEFKRETITMLLDDLRFLPRLKYLTINTVLLFEHIFRMCGTGRMNMDRRIKEHLTAHVRSYRAPYPGAPELRPPDYIAAAWDLHRLGVVDSEQNGEKVYAYFKIPEWEVEEKTECRGSWCHR